MNPTAALELPAVRGVRDRIAAPEEAARLLAALSDEDRPVFAVAFYAGLRRGELLGLRWDDVDLAAGIIRVQRSWDPEEGIIETKTEAGRRTVPLLAVLRDYLDELKLRGPGAGPVFSFDPRGLSRRAETVWTRAKLKPITLHECRHSFASLMIDAGVNAKALSTFMGHASITITLDRYGHLFPGAEDEAAKLADAYIARANTAARLVQLEAAEATG